MRTLSLLAAALVVSTGAPALADPGKGKAKATRHIDRAAIPDYRDQRMIDRNRNGIADWRERFVDRDRDGIDDRREWSMNRYGGATCPPGLASKRPACVPPGQAKRMFREGQRLSRNYGYYTPYGSIPLIYRDRYGLDDDYRYIYRDDYIYEVDPTTLLVRRVINLILG